MKRTLVPDKQLPEIKLIKSTYYNQEKTTQELVAFLKTAEILSCSTQCALFEENFAEFQDREHAVMMNSGSSANLAVVQALLNLKRIEKGDMIGFSALTWSTNVMPIIQLGFKAVPVDVELDTLNVSSKTFGEILKKHRIKMMFLTNLLGFCDDIDKIRAMCRENKIILIEDNCESLGTVYKGKKLGNWGWASTCSFYVGHHMSTVEGGIVCTNNDELATMLKIVRAHGWDRNLGSQKQNEMRKLFNVNSSFYSRYTFYDLGYNLRPTEIAGFLGNVQIKYLDEIIAKREANFKKLSKAIYAQTDKYYPIKTDHIDLVSNFAFPIVCKSKELRNSLVKKCNGKVEIRPIVGGDMTRQPFFKKHMGRYAKTLGKSNARLIHDQGLYFGNNPELTERELDFLIELFTN